MNVYEKMQLAKVQLLEKNLKKSGENKFSKFFYYELADILPSIIQICNELKLFTAVSFTDDLAVLEIIDVEKPENKIIYTSPMRDLELKGCNKIQSLGGTETYSRRYLYMSAFDIIESDMFDGRADNTEIKTYACSDCGKPFESFTDKNGKVWNAGQVYHMSEKNNADGKARCRDCKSKL